MKKRKKLNVLSLVIFMVIFFETFSFAGPKEIRYPLTPTVTGVRIFFAILVIILFIVSEIAFEKIRVKRIAKRNEENKNSDK